MGSGSSCLSGRRADASVPAEAPTHVAVEEQVDVATQLDKTHDSAESGTTSTRSSIRKSIPLSISLPDLATIGSTRYEPTAEPARGTPPRGTITAAISRSESMARMASIKDAARDGAMEAALRNFEAKIAADNSLALGHNLASAPSNWAAAAPVEIQDRGLNSAPELFSDAAMRNALRKIAAMQMKQEQAPQRSRGASAAGSARASHRPSVDEEHLHNQAASSGLHTPR